MRFKFQIHTIEFVWFWKPYNRICKVLKNCTNKREKLIWLNICPVSRFRSIVQPKWTLYPLSRENALKIYKRRKVVLLYCKKNITVFQDLNFKTLQILLSKISGVARVEIHSPSMENFFNLLGFFDKKILNHPHPQIFP